MKPRGALVKYRKALLVYFLVNAIIAALTMYGVSVVPENDIYDATPLIPLKNHFYEILCVFYVIPVSASLGALVGGYALAPIYLISH